MDIKQLGKDLLTVAEALAPVVGLGDEVEAVQNIVSAVENLVDNTKSHLASDDQAALQAKLALANKALNDRLNNTIDKLG